MRIYIAISSIFILSLHFLPLYGSQKDVQVASGIIRAEHMIVVKSKSQGELVKINVTEGQTVKKGEVLGVIDDKQESIELKMAKLEYNIARREYRRIKKVRTYISSEEIEKKRDDVLRKKGQYDLKSYLYDLTKIRAPISGVIYKKHINIGETISVGQDLYEIVNPKDLYLDINIYANSADELKVGDFLSFNTVISNGIDGKSQFKGKIIFKSPVIDPSSGTVHIRLAIDNQIAKDNIGFILRPGDMAEVNLRGLAH